MSSNSFRSGGRNATAEPDDLSAERYLLAAIIKNNALLGSAADQLGPEDFSTGQHKGIFDRMLAMSGEGRGIDHVTLANSLRDAGELAAVGGLSYLVYLDQDMPTIPVIQGYIDIIREKSNLRRLGLIATTLKSDATTPGFSSRELISRLSEQILDLAKKAEVNPTESIGAIIEGYDQRGQLNSLVSPGAPGAQAPGLYTGFDRFDELTGGLLKSEILIVAATSGLGKTALALNIVRNIVKPLGSKGVMLFSMEQTKEQIFARLACSYARVAENAWRRNLLTPTETQRFYDATDMLRTLPIYIDDNTQLNAARMRMKLENVMRESEIALVIADFLQLTEGGEDNKALTRTCYGIQSAAKDLGPPWILLSQLNRREPQVYGPSPRGQQKSTPRPTLQNLLGAGAIGQIGNVISFLYRDESQSKPGGGEEGPDDMEWIIPKNRSGPRGTIALRFFGWRGDFVEQGFSGRY